MSDERQIEDFVPWRERTCEACKEPIGEDLDSFTFCRDGESPPCVLYHGACWDEVAQPLMLTELNKSHTKLTELHAELSALRAAQPLTRAKLELMALRAGLAMSPEFYGFLGDLLDSLADGETK